MTTRRKNKTRLNDGHFLSTAFFECCILCFFPPFSHAVVVSGVWCGVPGVRQTECIDYRCIAHVGLRGVVTHTIDEGRLFDE